MGRSFQTDEAHAHFHCKPLRVSIRLESVFEEAKNLVADLRGWVLVSDDGDRHRLICRRDGGLLRGESTITIALDGPSDLPSTTVNVRSETRGGLLPRDRANVLEFMEPFHRRVC